MIVLIEEHATTKAGVCACLGLVPNFACLLGVGCLAPESCALVGAVFEPVPNLAAKSEPKGVIIDDVCGFG